MYAKKPRNKTKQIFAISTVEAEWFQLVVDVAFVSLAVYEMSFYLISLLIELTIQLKNVYGFETSRTMSARDLVKHSEPVGFSFGLLVVILRQL